ncbi:MAG: hypothetical protein H7330_11125 [Hymenobacteraceae bacterium]|nr:hypothetical protein [Hymenobacteraceae bacterium]
MLFHAWTTYADAPRKLDRPSLRLLKESLGFRLVVLPEGVLADTILWPRLVGIYQGFPVIIDFEEKQLRRHAPVPKLRLRILTSAGYRKGLMTRPHLEQTQSGNSDELWNIGFTRMWRADDFEPLTLVEWEKILRGATDELRTIGFAPAPPDWKFTD